MNDQRRIANYGITIGRLPKGKRNKITDVAGVKVGHCTVESDPYKTGVTIVVPCQENPFFHKPVAAVHVLNGFGKSLGLMQVSELGTIETPIALTGTLNVGLVHDAMVQAMLDQCKAEGSDVPNSINPVVFECNDGKLSKSVDRPVKAEHVFQALRDADEDFLEGSVGAGRGMLCHGLKGGIGSASRIIELDGVSYTVGLLVMTNHGNMEDFMIDGKPVGKRIAEDLAAQEMPERGSVIVVMATDLPVGERQLLRILKRAPVGLARLGSFIGHGSGEVMVGFTTANWMPFEEGPGVIPHRVLREDLLNEAFRAVAECCEESVLNAMILAETTTGFQGNTIYSLRKVWQKEYF